MAGENGKNGRSHTDKNGQDPKTGKFVEGNQCAVGHGRPTGTLDFMRILRLVAKESGKSEEDLYAAVIKGLMRNLSNGDTRAGQILLDRGLGPVPSGPDISIDNRSVTIGPPKMSHAEQRDWIERAAEVVKEEQERLDDSD